MAPVPSGLIPQRRLVRAFSREGEGVHTGAVARVTVAPAPFGTGITFRAGHQLPARIEHVTGSEGATALGLGPARVVTVEHLLGALYGAGITDAWVTVRGPELPILDGSARPWADGIAAVGTETGPPAAVIAILEVVRVEEGATWAELRPCARCEVAVEVDYDDPMLPRGAIEVALEGERFREEVAWARTFVLERDILRLRDLGRGRGATPENTVVWGSKGPSAPLRAADEPVRHKLLDAVGDLALLGAPLRGRMVVHRGSHALHHHLLRTLRERKEAWTLVEP
ncbi:MAG: UDP-3-O-acyl-N-acetylglucosamine deacetylase [Deltaproteobacteria bacterium]|nr:UDP-3-O-acyl-N-acetylglucosamine deacetylase [Deltaproteobacteria bacterium]